MSPLIFLLNFGRSYHNGTDPTEVSVKSCSNLKLRGLTDSTGKREIKIHEAPRSEARTCKDPISVVDRRQLATLDPTGARAKLFDKTNNDRARVGDVLLTTFKSGEQASGVILSIKGSAPHTSVLLRNNLT